MIAEAGSADSGCNLSPLNNEQAPAVPTAGACFVYSGKTCFSVSMMVMLTHAGMRVFPQLPMNPICFMVMQPMATTAKQLSMILKILRNFIYSSFLWQCPNAMRVLAVRP